MSKNPLEEDKLYQVALYLSRPEVETEIHAEILHRNQEEFEKQYKIATENHPLPPTAGEPYYIWPPGANKYGKELRIYFKRVPPEPSIIKTLYTDHSKWYAKKDAYRINHSALVMQLFECGFILGKNSQNTERVKTFMNRKFPSDANKAKDIG